MKKTKKEVLQLILRVAKLGSKAFMLSFFGAIIIAFSNFFLGLLGSLVIAESIKQIMIQQFDYQPFIKLLIIFAVILPILYLGRRCNLIGGQRASVRLKEKLIESAIRQPQFISEQGNTSDVMTKMTNDCLELDNFYFQGISYTALLPTIMGLLAIALIFSYHVIFGVISLVIGGLGTWLSLRTSRLLPKEHQAEKEIMDDSTKVLSELISNNRLIRLSNLKNKAIRKYQSKNEIAKNHQVNVEKIKIRVNSISSLFLILANISVLYVGWMLYIRGEYPFENVFILISLQQMIMFFFSNITLTWNYFCQVSNSAKRIFDIIDAEQEDLESGVDISSDWKNGKIEFRQVCFSYNEKSKLFDKLNFEIPLGKTIAFVGASGSGKTTIFQLLMRLYEIDCGEIWIAGQNIKELSKRNLRRNIAYVEQQPHLFQKSILENILVGSMEQDPTKESVILAAKKAHIHDFIETTKLGYDTVVTGDGNNFSGGQKQRISIARALLKESPILLLDEITSALDSESELAIQKTIEEIRKEKTILISAHRLSTIKNADAIVVFKDGEILGIGKHEELLESNHYYKTLNELQRDSNRGESK